MTEFRTSEELLVLLTAAGYPLRLRVIAELARGRVHVSELLFNYVLVATARLHATVARVLLRAPEDPLGEAREVLNHPGPLRRFIQNGSATPPGTPGTPGTPGSPPAGPSQPAGHG